MRRRRKTGNGTGTKKRRTRGEIGGLGTTTSLLEESRKLFDGVDMSVTAVDVVDTTTNKHFGHGHHHQLITPPGGNQMSSPIGLEVGSTATINKAVGARKRKPTQISKIVDKPEPEVSLQDDDDSLPHHNNNNNNSPPYKKALIQNPTGEKNGIIQNIVTELKSAKKASSAHLDPLFLKTWVTHPRVIVDERGSTSEEEENVQIETEEREEDGPRRKRANKKPGEGKVDLANIRTLLSSSRRSSGSEDAEDDRIDMRKGWAEIPGDMESLPYRCGVCRFGTLERGALLGHMKTHSGERSFQCRLCCFAFTTKANCERHLRNRHGKIEKDQIRNLVVVFSSSSSNNSDSDTETLQNLRQSPASSIPIHKNTTSGGHLVQHRGKGAIGNGLLNLSHGIGRFETSGSSVEKLPSLGGVPLVTTVAGDDEQPLDLSMDAVDLSTKSRSVSNESGRGSLLRPRPIYPMGDIPNLLVTSPFVTKREPMVHPQLSLQMLGDEQYNGLFNGYSPFSTNAIRAPEPNGSTTVPTTTSTSVPQPFSLFPFGGTPSYNPFSFPTPTMDKVVSGLSKSVTPTPVTTLKCQPTFMAPSPPASFESRESVTGSVEKEMKHLKSTKKESKKGVTESSSASSLSPTTTSRKRADPKNGEYQKPKQRRYRTERPFSCPHCPARFTLRSNMERHGKHQHPNVWQRSPSNRVINKQKNQQSPLVGPPTMVHALKHSNNSGFDGKSKNSGGTGGGINGDLNSVDVRAVIAQQLKRKLSNSALLNGTVGVESESESDHNGTESGRGDSSDLASVSQLLDRVKNPNIAQYFHDQGRTKSLSNSEDNENENEEEEDLSGTESPSGSSGDEDDLEEVTNPKNDGVTKKKSAYSSAPHKISCPHCSRKFPWTSSLRRHLLTHTGQKPYQCSKCPLLFTTKSNCDRHLARKHSGRGKSCTGGSGYNSTEDDEEDEEGQVKEEEGGEDVEEQMGGQGEEVGTEEVNDPVVPTPQKTTMTKSSANSSPGEDVSFRCHLCEAATTERDVLLAHMEEDHKETYSLLVSKGALTSSPPSEASEAEPFTGDPKEKEATHRKVMCVFCIRRFWSVEDLRRHIRSHSGERPFSCTHCSRRFTLKHSMLRHLKKHVGQGSTTTTIQTPKGGRRGDLLAKKIQNGIISRTEAVAAAQGEETNLIGRLLGIHDEGLVEQLLNKPDAKDAAKLLGLRVGLTRQPTSLKTSN